MPCEKPTLRFRASLMALVTLLAACATSLSLFTSGSSPTSQAQSPIQTNDEDWPMLAHDLARSNATSHRVDPGSIPFPGKPVWVRDFASGDENSSELVFNQYQPIVVGGLVYVGTSRNNMYALDTETGAIVWVHNGKEPGMIMASPSVVNNALYYAATNGHVYALDAGTGGLLWDREIVRLGGFRTSPAAYSGSIYLGAENGTFYALNAGTGAIRWTYDTGAPILNTAAIDVNRGQIYFANEDLYGFALDLNGGLHWKSAKFHGISTRRFYPVIADNGSTVLFRTSPGSATRALNGGDTLMARNAGLSIPDDFTHINHGDYGANVHASYNATRFQAEQTAIVNWLTNQYPEYETLYALNASNGSKRFVTALLWSGGSGQVGEPPVVSDDGAIYVRARSYYGNFDSDDTIYHFGTPATLDLSTGRLQLLRLPSEKSSWETGIFIIGDEASAISVAGSRLYFYSHGDAVGTVLPSGQETERLTCSRDIPHAITSDQRDLALPFGQDGLTHIRFKGGAGGGSSLFDQPVAIADGKIFFASQGMIGMYQSGFTGEPTYIADSRGSQPPTGPIALPPSSELESYVTDIKDHAADLSKAPDVVAELEARVADLVSGGRYKPFIELAGKKAGYIYFRDPTEEAYILALAYPYLSASLKGQVRSHLDDLWAAYPDPLNADTAYRDLAGRRRERYEIDNDAGQYAANNGSASVAEARDRLYHLWGYAYYTGDWDFIVDYWGTIRSTAHSIDPTRIASGSFPNRSVNRRVASLIGYARMADHLRSAYPDEDAYQNEFIWALDAATTALRARLQWEENHRPTGSPWSRRWMREEDDDDIFAPTSWGTGGQIPRYNGLVSPIARALRDYAWDDVLLQNAFVDTVIPAQHLAWSFIPNRGEIFSNLLPQSREVFLAKALIMEKDAEALLDYLSYAWSKGDLYYVERLVYIIRALGPAPTLKNADRAFADYGGELTYTISIVGTGTAMTVTDRLPTGLAYVDGSAAREPEVGILTDHGGEIEWTGTLTASVPLHITFDATVTATQSEAITNIAVVNDGSATHEYPFTVIANGFKWYLPALLKVSY